MKKILLPLLLLSTFFITAQFNQHAPWMQELDKEKEKNQSSAKTQQKAYTLNEISEAFEKYWETHDADKKGSGFKPFMRWKAFWENQVNSDGTLPTGYDVWQSYLNKQNSNAKVNQNSNWTSVGPFSHGSLGGSLTGQGRVNAVAVDPNNSNVWYVGAPAGGIWKSTNAGSTWVSLFDDFLQTGVSGIAVDPNDSNTIYISTGDDDAADSYSIGAFKSTDGGATWNITGLVPEEGDVDFLMNEITIDPTNSNIIWAGTSRGLQKSEDAGATWTVVRTGNIADFKLKPGDPQTVYAVNNLQFFVSTDGGSNFTQTTSGLPTSSGRLAIGVSAANPELVYVVSANTNNFSYQGLYKSTDSGVSFTETANNEDIFESSQAWFDLAIEVNPADEDEVYIGVLNIWRSSDGGDTFTQLNQWFNQTPSYSHADIHTLKFFNGSLFCGSDGGIYMSDDRGATFTDYTAGIAISQFYRISVAKSDPSKMAGGLQDNSGFIRNNGMWNVYTGGDGMDYEIDPTNSNFVYGFLQFGGRLFISNNSGQAVGIVGDPGVSGNWITPLAVNSVGEVFSGFDRLYRLNGNVWEALAAVGGANIDEIVIDPSNDDIMYMIENETIFRSTDRGNTFSFLTSFESDISDVAVNSLDGNILYVTTSNRVGIDLSRQQSLRGVFKLTINGNTGNIENITGNIPTDQAFFAIAHQGRHSDNPVYVGTNLGVYRIDDTLTEWEVYDTGLPTSPVSDLEISLDGGLLTASTYGRGVWQSPIPLQDVEDEIRIASILPESNSVFCNGVIPEISVENVGNNPVTTINVSYTVNDGTPENFDWTGNLGPDQTVTIPFPSFSVSDNIPVELVVTATNAEDTYSDNNTLKTFFVLNETGTVGDVFTFESDSNLDLIAFNEIGASEVVWERGVPTGTLLNSVTSGTQVYGTNLDGNHPDGTKGILLSKCYDLSNVLAPKLEFNMAYDIEINFDVAYVEYSTNNGTDWNLLGTPNSQPNWYNSDRTNATSGAADDCQVCPGGQWTGTDAVMQLYSYDFQLNADLGETDLTNETNILFRMVFESDPFVNEEGVIIDDFTVTGFVDDDDDDNDGIPDNQDNCPLTANEDQANNDNDGEGDVCDPDDDNDGILDIDDNCPFTANADQADFDGDGIGDVCDDDIDNDGVPNNLDSCPSTPANAVIDATGCEIFSLPSDNFSVLSTGETCISNNDGSISISAVEDFNYTVSLSGDNFNMSNTFTDEISFSDLQAGIYEVCITLAENAEYENCFDLTVSEPDELSVSSKVSDLDSKIDLELSGGNTYFITLNDEVFVTTESQISLPLKLTENKLSITTEQFCQGEYKETILLNDDVLIYPNPVEGGDLTILLGSISDEEVELHLFGTNGVSSIFKKSYEVQNGIVQFNVDALANGIYILNIKTEGALLTYKIIRK